MWIFGEKGESGFAASSTAEKFTYGINGYGLTVIVTGILSPPFKLSEDRIELHFATNHLGHFLLTNLLLEKMKVTSYEQKTEGRIVNVSSGGHRFVRTGIFSDQINDESKEEVYITANSLHPGFIVTEIFHGFSIFTVICNTILKHFSKDVSQEAAMTFYLAQNPKMKGITGEYFSGINLAELSPLAKDQELAKKLWEFSLSLTSS